MSRCLYLVGYGNPGRLDDGLGPQVAEFARSLQLTGVKVEANYQLEVEDASEAAAAEVVIFADASETASAPFEFYEIRPSADSLSFSTHSVKPEGLLKLAEDLFGNCPEAYILAVRGYDFNEFGEGLSEQAQENLQSSCKFLAEGLKRFVSDQSFDFRSQVTTVKED